ncbi:MAG: hypothetical protein K2G36_05475 [Ruminococcus sp.]|nr:hypothetical protein [Ruminococcus sp.]
MSDKKINDILDEYSTGKPEPVRGRTVTAVRPESHKKNAWDDNTLRQPVKETPPLKRTGKKITVLNGGTDADGNPVTALYDSDIINTQMGENDVSRIRRMNDSTRAREAEERKKSINKRKSKETEYDYTYQKETPDGEYMYTPPVFKKKKRSREAIIAEAEDPENLKLITDIVPSPAIIRASENVKKRKANIRRTDYNKPDSQQSIDIRIDTETIKKHNTSDKKRTKRIVDFNYYGEVEDVGRDIKDLTSIITTRTAILFILSFLSLYITFMNQLEFPIVEIFSKANRQLYLIVHLITGLIAVLTSGAVITNGLKKLFTFRADSDSMTAVTVLTCILSIIPAIASPDSVMPERIYMPIGILALLTNAIGKMFILRRAQRNFELVSKKDFQRHGIVYVRDEERAERLTRGTLGDFPILASMRKTDFLTDFLKYTYSSDITDKYCKKATPICIIVSIVISLIITFFCKESLMTLDSVTFGMSIYCMLICFSSCIAMPFVANMPLERVSNRAMIKKGVMLGYQSVDDFYDTNSILVNTDSMFPAHSVQLCGVKVFSNTKVNEALLEAASLTTHAGSVMRHLFTDVVNENNDILYEIDNFSFEESMGLCGWIHNRRVLFGNRELMVSHNIEGLPTKSKESEYTKNGQEAMYLSISGNIAALFTVEIKADREVKRWVKRLSREKMYMILKSVDACLTLDRIASIFNVSRSMFRLLPKKLHADFDAETKKTLRLSSSMACSGKFSAFAQLIIGTKVVHTSAIRGLILQTVSIILGFVICTLLIISKAFQFNYLYMSAAALIAYHIICTIITCIVVSSKKF